MCPCCKPLNSVYSCYSHCIFSVMIRRLLKMSQNISHISTSKIGKKGNSGLGTFGDCRATNPILYKTHILYSIPIEYSTSYAFIH